MVENEKKKKGNSFLKSKCEMLMLIRTLIVKSTMTPRGYASRPLRVQRNREIINIMMLPAKND